MKIVKKKSSENCNFYSHEKSLYIAWACFRNVTVKKTCFKYMQKRKRKDQTARLNGLNPESTS